MELLLVSDTLNDLLGRFRITPVNYNLFVVNVFMGMSALYQLYRKT